MALAYAAYDHERGRASALRAHDDEERGASSPAPVMAVPPQVVLTSVNARLSDQDREALRAMLRDELRARPVVEAAAREAEDKEEEGPQAVAPKTPLEKLAPAQRQAYEAAAAAIDESVRRRVWSESDRLQLRAAVGDLPAEAKAALYAPLVLAVNAGDVHFEGRGPLF